MEYFTSDHHFFHKNVLKFEDRPCNTVEEMNELLIERWNKVVSKGDKVHHLGDFSFGSQDQTIDVASRLNGQIVIYKGNHDNKNKLKRMLKEGVIKEYHLVGDYIKRNGYQLWLTHYPVEIGYRPNMYSIHGHIHSSPSNYVNHINVGVDSLVFKDKVEFGEPISLEALLDEIKKRNTVVEKLRQWNI